MTDQTLQDERREYLNSALDRSDLTDNPFEFFQLWLAQARRHAKDATAMSLATADQEGWPSVRTVLLKDVNEQGFVWFTDTESQKGRELLANPKAEIHFYWHALERQVRIQGTVTRVDETMADKYFQSRPLGSRLSAVASHQSAPVDSRETLEAAIASLQAEYPDEQVPKPARWGGFCLEPLKIEFWQGRESRLHDRFVYRRDTASSPWNISRIQP